MNILHISSGRVWRGGERQTLFLIQQQLEDGHTVHLMCRDNAPLRKKIEYQKVIFHSMDSSVVKTLINTARVKKITSTFEIDIIHGQDSHAHTYIWLASVFLDLRTPSVISRRLIYQKSKISRKYNHPNIRKIICVSEQVKQSIQPIIRDQTRLLTIYSGVDLETKTLVKSPSQQLRIGYVAALYPEKNHKTFISCAQRIKAKNISFHIYGDGPLKNTIVKWIKEKGNIVHYHGHVDEISSIYSNLDIILHLSLEESLGSSIIDAMKYGLPVIASNIGGIPELIRDGEGGFLVDPNDLDSICDKIHMLCQDHSIRNNFCITNLETVKKFDKKLTHLQTIELYQQVLHK